MRKKQASLEASQDENIAGIVLGQNF